MRIGQFFRGWRLGVLAVVLTGNHWWLDGMVAAALLPPIAWVWMRVGRFVPLERFSVRLGASAR